MRDFRQTFVSLWSTGNPRKQLQPIVGESVRFGWLAIVLGGIFHENMFNLCVSDLRHYLVAFEIDLKRRLFDIYR